MQGRSRHAEAPVIYSDAVKRGRKIVECPVMDCFICEIHINVTKLLQINWTASTGNTNTRHITYILVFNTYYINV